MRDPVGFLRGLEGFRFTHLVRGTLPQSLSLAVPHASGHYHSDSHWMEASCRASLTLTAMDRLVGWRREASARSYPHSDRPGLSLSSDLSVARERLAVRLCLADACDPRRA
jgi:hypothetical protein